MNKPLSNWYKKNITDMALDNYYNARYEQNPEEPPTDQEIEMYEEYIDGGGEMDFIDWQKYIRDTWED